ncbi:MAG: Gmad2 immunoglobulin-like domain-containing protein [Actinomycetota bacterium]
MMKRIGLAIAAVALVLSACADRGAGSLGRVSEGVPPGDISSPSPELTTGPGEGEGNEGTEGEPSEPRTFTYQVWLTQGEGFLFVSRRTASFEPAVGRIALNDLLSGPSQAERGAFIGTEIPAGTELLDLNIEDGLATVDLSGEFAQGGSSLEETVRLAQVVYTITQFDTVRSVRFRIDGEPVEVFGSHGIVLDRPQTRRGYQEHLPAILVESPTIGQRVGNPVTVSGTANVFEATVSLRILNARGKEIARTFTTATCGTGCRGDYSVSVAYDVDREQPGVIEVFESSAEDGRPINVVRIPVTLTP